MFDLLRRAGRGVPLGAVRLLLESARRDVGTVEVFVVFDDRRHRDPDVAVVLDLAVEVLGDEGVLTVRHAVLADVAGLQPVGDDLQRSVAWAGRRSRRGRSGAAAESPASAAKAAATARTTSSAAAEKLPARFRTTLPGWF